VGGIQSGQSGEDRTPRHGFFHQSIRRTRRDRGHAGNRACSGWWLDERELERVSAHRSGRREYRGIERDTLPGILCQCYWHRELRRRQQSTLGSGTYAEPLIPFNDPETGVALCGTEATLKACNATISEGQNQPYWIDISVPRGPSNSPPGIYTGTISITADQGQCDDPGHTDGVEL